MNEEHPDAPSNGTACPPPGRAARPAVLDTHVWLDWLAFEDPGVNVVVSAVRAGAIRPLRCARTRDELADVLSRPALRVQVAKARARRALAPPAPDVSDALRRFDDATLEHPDPPACGLACRDPDDQPFIDLAVAAGARWLVTRDRALLELARDALRLHGVTVLTPAGFARAQPSSEETEPSP